MSPIAVTCFTFDDLLHATGGQPLTTLSEGEPVEISTDTRTIGPDQFFLPLSGERFDGHDYLGQAFAAGAVGAFVQQDKAAAHPEWRTWPNLIAVPDPVQAYLDLGRFHRRRMAPVVVGVTGSSGKTTTKEMLAAAFSPLRRTQKTEKNYNNEIGVSKTLLAIEPETNLLVVEMAMRGPRQIAPLSVAAEPDVAIINNIGPAHIEMLGSLEAIARAKLEIVEGMNPETGVLVINGDDPWLTRLAPTLWKGRLLRYHLSEAEGIRTVRLEDGSDGMAFEVQGHPVTLSVPGEHQVSNALGVLKVGEALGFGLAELIPGLCAFRSEKGRWERQPLTGYERVTIINDAYNANPDSARASLKAFLSTRRPDQRAFIVLGGMKELGDFSRAYHEELGAWLAGQAGIDALFTVGEEGAWMAEAARQAGAGYTVTHAGSLEELIARLKAALPRRDAVLYLKGSRAYGLESIPDALSEAPSTVGEKIG